MRVDVEEHQLPLGDELLVEAIAEAAADAGVETYLVGGFVRDRLLGRGGKDVDLLAVGDDGTAVLAGLARRFHWSPPQRFDRFGTGQIRGDGFVVEVVRARAESYDPASRKPEVRPGTLEDDVWRRDFTVNALCQTMSGHVLDITGQGLDDLRHGILRTPLDPERTFSEDPLRMFRAARFAAQLGFATAPGLTEAMRRMAPRSEILSAERVAEELRRLLVSDHPRAGLELLRDGGLLAVWLPELEAMVGVEQGGFHIYDVFDHTAHSVAAVPPDLVTRLAALLHDVGKPPTHAVDPHGKHTFYDHPQVGADLATALLSRLRFSNDEIAAVSLLVRHHLRPIQYRPHEWTDAAVRRLVRDIGEQRGRLLDLARGDTRASSFPDTITIDELDLRMRRLDAGGAVSELRAPLDGNEIIRIAGGRTPGPWVGRVSRALEEAVLEGDIPAADAAAARRWLDGHRHLFDD
ncbi:MAG TPA: HD domain-containing protein [Candidatus Dormibacteraeota bacterium]|jgi:poly(A) polymerase|nr:HD domain-containing protein [Candidatus Dormibacteraeota bacterium]